VVREKAKYNPNQVIMEAEEDGDGREALNIMHDKRVFRGNTHNMQIIKSNLTPAQKEEIRIKDEREKKKVEMIKS
jgi:hypothetical protein